MSRSILRAACGSLIIPLASFALASPAQAQVANPFQFTNNVFTQGPFGFGTLTSSSSGPVDVPLFAQPTYSPWWGTFGGTNGGSVSALQSTVRASASLSANQPANMPGDTRHAKTTTDFTKRVQVLATQGSTLQVGDAVDLALTIRFDGLSRLGLPTGQGAIGIPSNWERMLTSTDISMGFKVHDLTNLSSSEGPSLTPTLIGDFGYGARFVVDQRHVLRNSSWVTEWDEDIKEGWNAFGNLSGSAPGSWFSDYQSGLFLTPYTFSRWTAVPPLTLMLRTTVGSELEVRASLDLFLQAMGVGISAVAFGDFANTFDAELYSMTTGAYVFGEMPGVYGGDTFPMVAPEPATWALLASGLMGMLLVSRTRRIV